MEKYGVEMIGARPDVIAKAEEREQFKQAMEKIGLEVCRGRTVHTLADAREVLAEIGLPCVIRPSFTMGGSGSAIAYNRDEFDDVVRRGLELSPVSEVLIEESIIGWKEYEMEVMRDVDDNVVIICSIENFDPMGVHTGDSITVAPAQTLTDKEYQRMRDASLAVIREIGVETGGSNIQFAIHPQDRPDDRHRNEPARQPFQRAGLQGDGLSDRQDRGQAGGGLPAARAAERHHPRDAWPASSRRSTMWSPRFRGSPSKNFPKPTRTLTTQMKSVGETMAIGRTFKESFQKALRGLEVGSFGFGCDGKDLWGTPAAADSIDEIRAKLADPERRAAPGTCATPSKAA